MFIREGLALSMMNSLVRDKNPGLGLLGIPELKKIPTTRYQGSKRKLIPWLYNNIVNLKFDSVLDIFGGTGIVSYLFKKIGKEVTYNDYLKFNYYSGKALIENDCILLNDSDIEFLLKKHKTIKYSTFVQDTFTGIYYTDEENKWIDIFLCNLANFPNIYSENILQYKKALAFTAFAQSAIKKRPFNLFHRANLYLRLKNVKRTFGNKTSWEGSFDLYFKNFTEELNGSVFDNNKKNKALNMRVAEFNNSRKNYDLLYIDPPYVRKESIGSGVDYLRFYHFLEGACDLENWGNRIKYDSPNLRIEDTQFNAWIYPGHNRIACEALFERFKKSIIVISYKDPGIPSKRELIYSLKKYKKHVISVPGLTYDYALNKNNGFHKEYLLIGLD